MGTVLAQGGRAKSIPVSREAPRGGEEVALHPYARFARLCAKLIPPKQQAEARAAAVERSSESFLKAIRFSRLHVDPLEVELAAYVACVLVLLGTLGIGAVVAFGFLGFEVMDYALYVAFPGAVLGLLALQFLAKFPELHAGALRARTAGQMPEAISYLALSMQLNPSLTRAVSFAADHTQEPIAGSLRNVLWSVYTRKHARIEDAFVDFAFEWGDWNEDLKKSLYMVRAAEMESTREGREATLDKATTAMYRGARAIVEDFAFSLSGPSTVFFAAGVILPIIMASMLPLMSLGGTGVSPTLVTFLFDVLFPALTFGYAWHILQKRPGTSPLPAMDTRLTTAEKAKTAFWVVTLFAAPLSLGFAALQVEALAFLGYLPFLWAGTLPLAAYASITTSRVKKERDRIRKLESEYPDALYQMGSRMGEGHPIEHAMEQTAKGMRGTEIANLLSQATYRLQVTKTSVTDALLGPDGVLRKQPSRVVMNTMKVAIGATAKEARTAGRTIVSVATYLREMLTVEREIQNRLKEVTDTMLTTGVFFAPVVLGVTVALSRILADNLAGVNLDESADVLGFSLGGGGDTAVLSPEALGLVVGIYLAFTVLISTYFVSGIRHGEDRIEWKQMVGIGLPLSMIVYSAVTIFTKMALA